MRSGVEGESEFPAGVHFAPAERDPAPAEGRGWCSARALLVAALIVGLLRFHALGRWSLWIDEALTYTDYYVGIEGGEIQNPLGYWLVHATSSLFGPQPDEFSLRFLPALAGWLCIGATYWAFRPLAGRRVAALAALLVAVSSWHVYWSQNARFYTLTQLATLVGAGAFVRGLLNARVGLALLGFLVTACSAAFHPSGALLAPALLVAGNLGLRRAGVAPRASRRTLLFVWGAAALIALIGLSWAQAALRGYFLQKGAREPFSDLGELVSRVAHLAKTTGFYFTPLLCASALVGAALAWTRRELAGVLAMVAVVSVLFASVVLAVVGARMTAQYVFFLLPWVALLAALPVEQLLRRADDVALPRAWAFVLVACSLTNVGLYFTVRRGERPAWREAYQFVWSRREENDLVLGMEASVGEFYVAPWRTNLRQPEQVQWLDTWRAALPAQWARHSRRMWLIVHPEQFLDWKPADAAEVQRFLREECRLVKVWPLYVESRDLSVWVYVRD